MKNQIAQQISDDKIFDLTLNHLFDGVYIVDEKREIIFWNKGSEDLTGFRSEEVKGCRCSENILNHIDENGVLLCQNNCPIVKVMSDGKPISAKVYPKHKNGKRFPVETHISAIYDDDGRIAGAIEVFRDISSQENYRILQEKFTNLIKRYVSNKTYDEVRIQIKDENTAIKSQQIDVTIMYIDVVGFTAFTEQNEPEETVEMLNSLFEICDVITRECFGDIDKYIGDAVMAIFTDANDAINSALKIINEGLVSLNKRLQEKGKEGINIRIGINSGTVIQGDIGTVNRKDLTVIGDAVNTAARIEKLSPVNRLLISEATLARANRDTFSQFSYYNELKVRGKTESIKLYINTN
jgi:PAS domain S-box-containing protein